jgi:hypothetical protein
MDKRDLKKEIPLDFYSDKGQPVTVDTVGEAIEQLKRLPEDLEISQGFSEGVRLIVYNISRHNPHLAFEEAD